ncbi:hypothetical protein JD844_015391 [Phrynosoma platyrhinos]|uniref:ZNFX1 domain-containing protein n=1 Tax=Phrynosoma platyrhinos TaxID=52577 RepID=A0ABQ7SJ53_PHRPL|nr:hypothetical protein JD844_015391 [Phrynosoma platyrhinos]
MSGAWKRSWSGSPLPPPSPRKAPRLSPEPRPPRSPESPEDIITFLGEVCDHSPKQLLSFFQTHNYHLARILGSPGLSPGKVYTLLRAVRRVLEGPMEAKEVQPVLELVLRPDFVLQNLLSFTANLETFRCQDGQISQEVMGDTVAALHHLLEAAPGQVTTLLCYPLDLLCATVRRLQSRGFHFTWITQKQLRDTRRLLDGAFLQPGESIGNAGGSLESPASREDFHLIPVFPTPEDIFLEPTGRLKANLVSGRYKNGEAYLDTHFRLLREDLVKPLRDGISSQFTLRSLFSDSQKPAGELRLYKNVQLVSVGTSPAGVTFLAKFLSKRNPASKCLLTGSLVCLISNDCDHVIFGTVAGSHKKEDLRGAVWLDIWQRHTKLLQLLGRTTFTMVESPAFFEAYRHVLEGLQEMDATAVPFRKHLVKCERDIASPSYLEEEGAGLATFDLRALHPPKDKCAIAMAAAVPGFASPGEGSEDVSKVEVPLIDLAAVSPFCPQLWTAEVFPHLDESQISAIRMALSNEFVLIQGPPGTGEVMPAREGLLKKTKSLLTSRDRKANRKGLMHLVNH